MTDPVPETQVSQARLKQDGCTGQIVFVVYQSVKSALEAIAKLHGQKLNAAAEQPNKRHKGDKAGTAVPTLWARQVSGEGLHLKKWRLIIRNLAFKVHHLGRLPNIHLQNFYTGCHPCWFCWQQSSYDKQRP